VREWAVTLARLSIAKQVVMPANPSGKLKTMAQALALGGLIAPFHDLSGRWDTPGDIVWWIAVGLMVVAVALTMTSGAEFARDVIRHRRTSDVPAQA
jgi:CDP-diacylglycerol--glycerol-3-phosphate 3-phosphatidyltransferase